MSDEHTGSIIGLLPDFADDLTVPGGESVDDLHVTLVYLTDDHTTLTDAHRSAITSVMMQHRDIIECSIVGVRKLGNDDPPATVLMLDSPELQALRVDVKAELVAAGVPVPEDTYPEYLPHITVGYGTSLDDAEKLTGQHVTFGNLAAFYGPDREHVALYKRPTAEEMPVMGERFFAPSIARMGVPTGDDRLILPGAISYRTLPIAYRWQEFDAPGHDGAVVIGAVDRIEIDPVTGNVAGYGELANPEIIPEVNRARELMRLGVLGISIDPGQVVAEMAPNGMTLFSHYEISSFTALPIPAFSDTRVMLESDMDMMPGVVVEAPDCEDEVDHNDMPPLYEGDDYGWLYSLTAAVTSTGLTSLPVAGTDVEWDGAGAANRVASWAGIDVENPPDSAWKKYGTAFLLRDDNADPNTKGAYKLGVADVRNGELTLIPRAVYAVASVLSGGRGGVDAPAAEVNQLKGAVRGLYEHLADALDDDSIKAPFSHSLIACAAQRPPMSWFEDPQLPGPTPIKITDDGRIYGHIGLHGHKHRGFSGDVFIPRSQSHYREFLLGETMTAEGIGVPTGSITLGGGHADNRAGLRAAIKHYDDASAAVASVSAGDDRWGVWISGAINADTTDMQIDKLRQHPPSGDWREDDRGNLELIVVHSVNSPGFPVYRVGMTGEKVMSLIASSAMVADASAEEPADIVFDLDGDLRAQFADAGIAWPTISATVGGAEFGPFEVAEGCVKGMLGGAARGEMSSTVDIEIDVPPVVVDDSLRRRNAARLRLMLGGF